MVHFQEIPCWDLAVILGENAMIQSQRMSPQNWSKAKLNYILSATSPILTSQGSLPEEMTLPKVTSQILKTGDDKILTSDNFKNDWLLSRIPFYCFPVSFSDRLHGITR